MYTSALYADEISFERPKAESTKGRLLKAHFFVAKALAKGNDHSDGISYIAFLKTHDVVTITLYGRLLLGTT
ncbi:MAG: hypothetical protein LBE38_09950 [Deltaproteobacteria bacterium]|jgi:hypothetical protein|nr:hypothetical protein [Deltaproteobacteria bacterium]